MTTPISQVGDFGPMVMPVPETVDETIARLAAMKPMDYDQIRKEEAKALGIQVKTLDDQVKSVRNQGAANDRLPFAEREPCADAVDPTALLNAIAAAIHEYMIVTREQADAAALWCAHTHLTDVADILLTPTEN